jgi:hypothetical protein
MKGVEQRGDPYPWSSWVSWGWSCNRACTCRSSSPAAIFGVTRSAGARPRHRSRASCVAPPPARLPWAPWWCRRRRPPHARRGRWIRPEVVDSARGAGFMVLWCVIERGWGGGSGGLLACQGVAGVSRDLADGGDGGRREEALWDEARPARLGFLVLFGQWGSSQGRKNFGRWIEGSRWLWHTRWGDPWVV